MSVQVIDMRLLEIQRSATMALAYRARASRVEKAFINLDRAVKYDADQPRAPAGQHNGGQWVGNSRSVQVNNLYDESTSEDDVTRITSFAQRYSIASKPDGYEQCLNLCYPLLERFKQPIWSDKNTFDFHKCMDACLKAEQKGF